MLYIFDLDYTLLDTANLKAGLAEIFGIKKEIFNKTYKKYFADKGEPYNFLKHAAYLSNAMIRQCSISVMAEQIKKQINNYIFPASEIILKKLKRDRHKLMLLTCGDIEWQKCKIDSLKIKKYFDKIVYAEENKLLLLKNFNLSENLNISPKEGSDPLKSQTPKMDTICAQLNLDISSRIIIVNDNARECLEMQRVLLNAEVFLVEGPYSHNTEHNFKIRRIEHLTK